jgi:hypothetical protein
VQLNDGYVGVEVEDEDEYEGVEDENEKVEYEGVEYEGVEDENEKVEYEGVYEDIGVKSRFV